MHNNLSDYYNVVLSKNFSATSENVLVLKLSITFDRDYTKIS